MGARLVACLALLGCAAPHAESSLEVLRTDGGAGETIHAHWSYASGEVDVEIDVLTTLAQPCSTTARLLLDEALAEREVYRLPESACETLRVTPEGDVVLYDQPTGHDWTSETLRVDTGRELITLGPWRAPDGVLHELRLRSRACGGVGGCDCPRFEAVANGTARTLYLGMQCD